MLGVTESLFCSAVQHKPLYRRLVRIQAVKGGRFIQSSRQGQQKAGNKSIDPADSLIFFFADHLNEPSGSPFCLAFSFSVTLGVS